METYLGIDWEEVRTTEELLAGRMDQLARKKEVLELGYKRMMEARAKSVRYWDSRIAHRLREPLVPGAWYWPTIRVWRTSGGSCSTTNGMHPTGWWSKQQGNPKCWRSWMGPGWPGGLFLLIFLR
ncbi:hypothetical protein PPACK8108_LOCUS11753 [Phakopsora pachyrhizi]|uniref:Uncharacterized protein n=1 Tax=Phakopsora pachyrhizi TaxID=170000 RepID=A0AAV0B149_PHAPC|nr:hypothetical protein PPACK8108_LOCUS11753 [Phakopsora pachyrhizi]